MIVIRQTYVPEDRQTDRQTDIQRDRQTKKTEKDMILPFNCTQKIFYIFSLLLDNNNKRVGSYTLQSTDLPFIPIRKKIASLGGLKNIVDYIF